MLKSKRATIALLMGLLLFFVFCQKILINFGLWYTYLLCPISFVAVTAILHLIIPNKIVTVQKNRKEISQYVIITTLLYIIIYLLSGLFTGFGKNPYDTSLLGLFINMLSNIPIYIALELMRYKLVNNVYKKDKKIIFILTIIVFSIWDLNIFSFLAKEIMPYTIFVFVFYNLIPIVIRNVLFTYLASNGDYVPSIIYKCILGVFVWTSPILPKLPMIFEAILSTVLPFFLLLYIRFFINSKDKMYAQTSLYDENPQGLVPFAVVLVMAIWFTVGVFPIKPVGVATASMLPNIKVGDMVILQETDGSKLKVGDVVGYKLDGVTVVHRIESVSQNENSEYVYTTKGDNNNSTDLLPVKEDAIVGKMVFKVNYVALPTIWLHSIYSGREDVGVETGN